MFFTPSGSRFTNFVNRYALNRSTMDIEKRLATFRRGDDQRLQQAVFGNAGGERLKHFLDSVLATIKLGRLGQVEDLMGAVQFLASDASALITATSLVVDGGWTAD